MWGKNLMKLKQIIFAPVIPFFLHFSQGHENSQGYMHIYVYCSTIYYNLNKDSIWQSINRCLDKEVLGYILSGVLTTKITSYETKIMKLGYYA